MASYNSGFDPMPSDIRGRRQGTYIHSGPVREVGNPSFQSEGPKRRQAPVIMLNPPRPKMREPSPVPTEMKNRGVTGPGFSFGRPTGKRTVSEPKPELKGKASRNVLRRKPSSISRPHTGTERVGSSSPTKWSQLPGESRPSIDSTLKSVEAYGEVFSNSGTRTHLVGEDYPRIYPELDRYGTHTHHNVGGHFQRSNAEIPRLATQGLPPFSAMASNRHSGSGYSASPSTRFSESPGPGAYSRDTTPTSMSSQSPGIMVPVKIATPRQRLASPTHSRPPLTRRNMSGAQDEVVEARTEIQGLPILRESQNSLSSGSSRTSEKKKLNESCVVEHSNSSPEDVAKAREVKKKKKGLSPSPPKPPPRKSSQKFTRELSQEGTPTKASKAPALPVSISPPSNPTYIPLESKPRSAPARPSREGTPNLLSQQFDDSMVVIQSNLVGIPFPQDRRRQSGIAVQRGISPQLSQPLNSTISSRGPSPNPNPARREGTPAPSSLDSIPKLHPPQEPHPSTRTRLTRTPSPSVANPSKPRFGLFGRRTKTSDAITEDTKEKVPRKGPAAGTGHEGYGKYATLRGRSASASRGHVRILSGGASSQESVASRDPFIMERMSPVVIAGGGQIVENRNTSAEVSRTNLTLDPKGSLISNLSQEPAGRTTLWPSALPKESKRESLLVAPRQRRPSDSSESGISKSSTLAFRRSTQQSNSSKGSVDLPAPIKIVGMGVSPSLGSLDSSIMSSEAAELERGRKGHLTKPRKLEKRPKSPRKWNFFHRAQPSTKVEADLAPSIVALPPVASVPHYALLDSSDEQQELDLVEVDDDDIVELSNEELDALQFGTYKENLRRIDDLNKVMENPATEPIPERRPMLFSSPEPMHSTPELSHPEQFVAQEFAHLQTTLPRESTELESAPKELHLTEFTAPIRPSRLAQVGRIPKVVSARPVATSPKSFSRPFARVANAQPLPEPFLDAESLGSGPSLPLPPTPPEQRQQDSERLRGLGLHIAQESSVGLHEFLAFSPIRNSEATTSSSGALSLAGTTAIIPEIHADLVEDEVWDEFDDLIETEGLTRTPGSATSSHGVPFQYENFETRRERRSKRHSKGRFPVIPSPDPTKMHRNSSVAPSPTVSMSLTDFFSGYGERNNSIQDNTSHNALRSSQGSLRKSGTSWGHQRTASNFTVIAEQESDSPMSQVNLRVGSMTVSKWLTFGHVLFSPAREELLQLEGSAKRHSVLVIDGLGNDDWSFYASETYPSATFYNLSPTRPLSASERLSTSSFPLTPPNHRQVQYLCPNNKFPFPSSTFHVVVFRFPTAMSEAAYRNIIAESKRVLKPGGYLEIAILDLDMMNMGNRARRAVRGLKVQLQVADPATSLGSASDTVLRLIGQRGFNSVKSCKVGVPVASTISEPMRRSQMEEVSLADMMKDESRAGDESITKMVARVGRWWYTRCYEMGVIPDGDMSRSIFNDGPLLGECEKWNSSFKLVVAYAQKPIQARRRTASV